MRILIARILRGGFERHEIGSWLAKCFLAASKDPRITFINDVVVDKCPTDAARNEAAILALSMKADVLVSVDHDNVPTLDFFTQAVDYLIRHPAAVVAAPYLGARPSGPGTPDREVQVVVKDASAPEGRRRVGHAEARELTGIRLAYGVGTVLAIGTPALKLISPPWWAYRYFDPRHMHVGTEDFVFSEKLVDAGGIVVVNWSTWVGHHKSETLWKPE